MLWSFKTSSCASTRARSRSSNRLVFVWKTWRQEPLSTSEPRLLRAALLLHALLIGIAPCADLQAPANPAQPFGRIGRTLGAADRALVHSLHLIRHHGSLRLFQKRFIDHRLGWRDFSFHWTETTLPCPRGENDSHRLSRPVQAHDVPRIERGRAPRAFLTRLHLGRLSCGHHDSFHGVRADRTVNKRLRFVLWRRLCRLRASLTVHASPSPMHRTQLAGQRIEKTTSHNRVN